MSFLSLVTISRVIQWLQKAADREKKKVAYTENGYAVQFTMINPQNSLKESSRYGPISIQNKLIKKQM